MAIGKRWYGANLSFPYKLRLSRSGHTQIFLFEEWAHYASRHGVLIKEIEKWMSDTDWKHFDKWRRTSYQPPPYIVQSFFKLVDGASAYRRKDLLREEETLRFKEQNAHLKGALSTVSDSQAGGLFIKEN